MLQTNSFSDVPESGPPVFMAAGFFDGVHLGHQRVIGAAREAARAAGGALWVLTFETHPLRLLAPDRAPLLLTSAEHKMRLIKGLGADGCLKLPFDRAWAALDPGEFLNRLRDSLPQWRALYVGPNWRFGRDAKGDNKFLRKWAATNRIEVVVSEPVVFEGHAVSSTRIRNAVLDGGLKTAAAMLGRPFSILGTVVKGRGMGRQIGFPTANVKPDNEVRPPPGVYAVAADVGARRLQTGVMNLGNRPTFDAKDNQQAYVIEVHLPGEKRDLYGCRIEVFIIERLRNETRFDGIEALRRQISADIEAAEKLGLERYCSGAGFTKPEKYLTLRSELTQGIRKEEREERRAALWIARLKRR